MIEREFIRQRAKYLKIREYIETKISKAAGVGNILIEKTPLGEKITINAVRPGLVIGRGGKSISELTTNLKTQFKLENPQIEVLEVENPFQSAIIVARKMAADLERFGAKRYKSIGYRALTNILSSGAIGAEIRISGRGIPGQKARSWRFFGGFMKKAGDVAVTGVDSAQSRANLRSGTVGIKVAIMPKNIALPDRIHIKEIVVEPVEEAQADKSAGPSRTSSARVKPLVTPKAVQSEAKAPAAPKEPKKKKPAKKKEAPKVETKPKKKKIPAKKSEEKKEAPKVETKPEPKPEEKKEERTQSEQKDSAASTSG